MQTQSSSFKLETTPTEAIQNWLINQLAEQLSLDAKTIKIAEPLTRYGLDSIDAVTMVGDLEDWLELELPSTLFWDHPTIEKSAQYLAENFDITSALIDLKSENVEAPIKDNLKSAANANKKKGWGKLWG
jgi:acyl carrier protein